MYVENSKTGQILLIMISDKIENITKYNIFTAKVSNFLKSLTPDVATGHYEIDDTAYANIDVYQTRDIDLCKFEAHKKYIDIQMLLSGEERLDYTHVDGLIVSKEYDPERDVMFFKNSEEPFDTVSLTPFKFAVLYPYEAHRPQMNISGISKKVKKVVVKIKV